MCLESDNHPVVPSLSESSTQVVLFIRRHRTPLAFVWSGNWAFTANSIERGTMRTCKTVRVGNYKSLIKRASECNVRTVQNCRVRIGLNGRFCSSTYGIHHDIITSRRWMITASLSFLQKHWESEKLPVTPRLPCHERTMSWVTQRDLRTRTVRRTVMYL
jgi:hypothetical protein